MQQQQSGPPEVRAGHFNALIKGHQERGELNLHPSLIGMGQNIARSLLSKQSKRPWLPGLHPSHPGSPAPWVLQQRKCDDGQTVAFISSLATGRNGAESRTGILRSRSFAAPETISFWVCGHRGHPDQPPHEKNFIRLLKTNDGKELHRVYPPRNDQAVRIEWDLSSIENQQVTLEIVDGDTGSSFAWLAVTRFDPQVARVDSFAPSAAHGELLENLARALLVSAPADLRHQLNPFLPSLPAISPSPSSGRTSGAEHERLEKLIRARVESFEHAQPRIEHGKAIFDLHCASCHQVAGEGALLGPQLDGIGARGAARLCEDILAPNRNVDAHFYLTTLTLKDGTTAAGFVRGESGEVLLLVDTGGKEHRIQKTMITARRNLPRSLMPSTFEHLIKGDDFNDLLGWLLLEKKQ